MEVVMKIIIDDLTDVRVHRLLAQHLQGMAEHSPEESIHALDLDNLRQPNITFWTCWYQDKLAGCGALKQLTQQHGEIKSMRTDTSFLWQGVAETILLHILSHAKQQGYERVSLETGSMDAFIPARTLYTKHGFEYCKPFDQYRDDPYSMFMTKLI